MGVYEIPKAKSRRGGLNGPGEVNEVVEMTRSTDNDFGGFLAHTTAASEEN